MTVNGMVVVTPLRNEWHLEQEVRQHVRELVRAELHGRALDYRLTIELQDPLPHVFLIVRLPWWRRERRRRHMEKQLTERFRQHRLRVGVAHKSW